MMELEAAPFSRRKLGISLAPVASRIVLADSLIWQKVTKHPCQS